MQPDPIRKAHYGVLPTSIYASNAALGAAAAAEAAEVIRAAVSERDHANIILATGNSQLTFLASLRETPGVPWNAVNVFHMDEYINLPPAIRPASRLSCVITSSITSSQSDSTPCPA